MEEVYFVSEALAARIKLKTTQLHSISLEEVVAESNDSALPKHEYIAGLQIPGVLVRGADHLLRTLIKRHDLELASKVLVGETIYTTLVGMSASSLSNLHPEMEKMPGVVEQLQTLFGNVSDYIGRDMHLHFVKGPTLTPYPTNPYEIRVVVGAVPPGSYEEGHRNSLCNIPLDGEGHYRRLSGPTRGYGVTVFDDEENPVGQIVGTTFYLFIPLPHQERWMFKFECGIRLYQETFRLLWNAYASKKEGPKEELLDLKKYTEYVMADRETMVQFVDQTLSELDQKIVAASRAYYELLREKESVLLTRSAYTLKDDLKHTPTLLQDEWERITQNKLLTKCVVVEKCLQVETVPIVLEHEGVRYSLNTFMLRITGSGTIHIWANNPTHPKQIPHPHISLEGEVCFGNIGLALKKASTEGRRADALDMVLEWLIHGYDETLTLHKIEEWPMENGSPSNE